jgi:hypothetical protein
MTEGKRKILFKEYGGNTSVFSQIQVAVLLAYNAVDLRMIMRDLI